MHAIFNCAVWPGVVCFGSEMEVRWGPAISRFQMLAWKYWSRPSSSLPFPAFICPPQTINTKLVISIYIYIHVYLGPPGPSFLRVTLKLQSLWPNDSPYITLGLKCAMPPRIPVSCLSSTYHLLLRIPGFLFRENRLQRLRMYEYNTTWAHHERLPKWATSVDDWLQRVPVSWLATNQKPHDVRDTQGNLNPLSHPDTQWVIQY